MSEFQKLVNMPWRCKNFPRTTARGIFLRYWRGDLAIFGPGDNYHVITRGR